MLLSIIFMIALIAVGVGFMYTAISGRLKSKSAQSWPTVKGKVVSSEAVEDRFRSATGKATIAYIPDVSYEYVVMGQPYTGKNVIFGEKAYDYIPDKPKDAVLETVAAGGKLLTILGAVMSVIGVVALIAALIF